MDALQAFNELIERMLEEGYTREEIQQMLEEIKHRQQKQADMERLNRE